MTTKHYLELGVVDLEARPDGPRRYCLGVAAERGCLGHAGTAVSGWLEAPTVATGAPGIGEEARSSRRMHWPVEVRAYVGVPRPRRAR